MSRRAAEYKRTSLSGEERKARLKQRCMEDVAAKRSKLIRSLRNAPGSVSQVGHSIVEAMQSECAAVDPEDPHAGLTEGEYQEIMVSLEDALMTLVAEEERVAKLAGARSPLPPLSGSLTAWVWGRRARDDGDVPGVGAPEGGHPHAAGGPPAPLSQSSEAIAGTD